MVQLINNAPKLTDPRVERILDPAELALYNSTTKPAKLCGTMLSALNARAGFTQEQEVYVSQMIGHVAGNISQVARIKLQAMPFGEWRWRLTCNTELTAVGAAKRESMCGCGRRRWQRSDKSCPTSATILGLPLQLSQLLLLGAWQHAEWLLLARVLQVCLCSAQAGRTSGCWCCLLGSSR